MSLPEIKEMSTRERLTIMEQLWDSLCREKDGPDSPDWHKPILENRKARMNSADARYYTVEQLRKEFR